MLLADGDCDDLPPCPIVPAMNPGPPSLAIKYPIAASVLKWVLIIDADIVCWVLLSLH